MNPPLIEYIPDTGNEEELKQIKRFVQAYVSLPEETDERYVIGQNLIKQLAKWEDEDLDCWGPALLAAVDDTVLQEAVRFFKTQLAHIYSFGGLILAELEEREAARIKGE
jgi:hypothetical protein